jgi:hypothetical protein
LKKIVIKKIVVGAIINDKLEKATKIEIGF